MMHQSNSQFSFCPHFQACAGCVEHLSHNPPPIWEEVLSFFLQLPTPSFHAGLPIHWRHRAKLAVRGTSETPLIGLFKEHSHDVASIPQCLVHHPHLNKAFDIVREWMKQHKIDPYQEHSRRGELRYLQGVVERKSGRVQLSFVLNASASDILLDRWGSLLVELSQEHPLLWHSLWINFNDQATNTIFGSDWMCAWGEKDLWEAFGDVDVCYGPASFGQANLLLFERMLFRLQQLIPFGARVAEFYAGVGAIGLCIASRSEWVCCSEINPFAEAYFHKARSKLKEKVANRLSFLTSSTKGGLSILENATTVIVDPPRKGLDPTFFSALNKACSIQDLFYISCGWEGFKRDYQQLFEQGWKVHSVDGYHFFPGSNHVELLVNFKR
ncbi:MAG: hypothetical protein ACH350_08415 [Parachlamydiaceae bacterium]